MKFAQFEKWLLWDILWRFQIKIRAELGILNVIYHAVLWKQTEAEFILARLRSFISSVILPSSLIAGRSQWSSSEQPRAKSQISI